MGYHVVVSEEILKKLKQFEKSAVERIWRKINELKNNPRPAGCKKLKGREGYRVRTGDYRIIYDIVDKQLIVIIKVDNRKDIYD